MKRTLQKGGHNTAALHIMSSKKTS